MKVLIVTQYFWPESFRINDMVKSLVEKNIKVDVLTGKPNYPDGKIFPDYYMFSGSKEVWHGASIYRVPLVPRGRKSKFRLAINYLSFIFFGTLVGSWLLRKKQYDIIFVYGVSPILKSIPAILFSWLKKCPCVIWVQDLWPESIEATGYVKNKNITIIVGIFVKWIYSHADLLLVQSRAFVESVSLMAENKQVLYYPNSVDASFLNVPTIKIPEISSLNTGFSVLFAGNIGSAQAVDVIVDAASILKRYSDINFVVVGSGSRLHWIEEQIIVRNLTNIQLTGRFPVEVMPGLMQKASALLVSLSDKAIFSLTVPNKIQAYMASGRPILACLNGEGARVVTEAQAGISIPAENSQELAFAILKLYRMTDKQRDNYGKNGRKYFLKNYEHEHLVEQLIGHFNNTIKLSKSLK